MTRMAEWGNGQFLEVGEQQAIDFSKFKLPEERIQMTMMDVFASFNFPTFYGFTSDASNLNAETWQVTIGFNVYSPVLFKGSAL